jgi:N-glycosylase/DNA lyase
MDGIQLRDEAVRDRIRACEEFLDPSMFMRLRRRQVADRIEMMSRHEAIELRS